MGEEIKISGMKETPERSGKQTEQRSKPRCVVFSDGVHGDNEMKTPRTSLGTGHCGYLSV